MNTDENILNKILVNQIQYYEHLGFIPGMKGWLNLLKPINMIHRINRLKKKSHSHMIISTDMEKAFKKTQLPIYDKTFTRNREECCQLDLKKSTKILQQISYLKVRSLNLYHYV